MIVPTAGSFVDSMKKVSSELLSGILVYTNNSRKPVVAKWDPGATRTVISPSVVKDLGLNPISKKVMSSSSHDIECDMYMVNISINSSLIFYDVEVAEMKIDRNRDVNVLIGMDIIGCGDFCISNFENETRFSFRIPSSAHAEQILCLRDDHQD